MKYYIKMLSIITFILFTTTACTNDKNSQSTESEKELTISAATSLQDALTVIQKNFQEEHPEIKLTFNYGATGSLQQQISQGAPVDVFMSASKDKFDLLVNEGNISKEDNIDLLGNELVLVVSKENEAINRFDDLEHNNVKQISIGTPETVPAGQYAKESLENIGIFKKIESKMIFAKDVRQVLSYVETGNVDAGIVYKTDALVSDKVKIIASASPASHTPIIYPVGIIKESKQYEVAKEFYTYLQSDAALKIFEEFGFTHE